MLQIENLQHRFGEKIVFEKINLHFSFGKTYGIVGANGVGKTTFFRVLSKIYKTQGGTIKLNNQPLSTSHISFLPTDPFFYSYMNGGEYLQIVLSDKNKVEQCVKMAANLHIPLQQLVESYSTGMKKKLALIACQAQERKVQIYDEPFNGVDLESNEIIKHWIKQPQPNHIKIISSHMLSSMTDICDEIYYIQPGFVISHFEKNQFNILSEKIQASINERMQLD